MSGRFLRTAPETPRHHPTQQTTSLNRPHPPLPFPASASIGVWSVLRTHQDFLTATAYRSPLKDRYSAKQQCRCVLTRSVACCAVGRGLSPPPYDVGEIPSHSSGNSPTSSHTADHLPQSPPPAIAVSRFRFNRCLVGASHPPRFFNGYRLPLPLERPLQRETAVSVCAHSVGSLLCGRTGAVAPSL